MADVVRTETIPARYRARHDRQAVPMTFAAGRKGAASELLVMTDLLSRGFEVYRAISGHAACDLVAEIEGQLYRVEVKTVGRDSGGYPRSPSGNLQRKGQQILAIVDDLTGALRYE